MDLSKTKTNPKNTKLDLSENALPEGMMTPIYMKTSGFIYNPSWNIWNPKWTLLKQIGDSIRAACGIIAQVCSSNTMAGVALNHSKLDVKEYNVAIVMFYWTLCVNKWKVILVIPWLEVSLSLRKMNLMKKLLWTAHYFEEVALWEPRDTLPAKISFQLRFPLITDTDGHRGDAGICVVMEPSRTLGRVHLLSEFGSRELSKMGSRPLNVPTRHL